LHYFITEYWHDLARPTLMSICCEAVGGDPNATIPFAVPLSLISGALDIQDDIIDQSKTKHGRPTVYGKYGKEIAMLAADALLFKGFALLNEACLEIPKEKAKKIVKIVKDLFYELGEAEALELNLKGRMDVTPEEYLHIIEKKAADVEAHTHIGAIIGNATEIEKENLSRYGRLLGMIIIIGDDLIDLLDYRETKNRIKNECLPLPVIYALSNQKRNVILRNLISNNFSKTTFKKLKIEIERSKGFESVKQVTNQLVNEALRYIRHMGRKLEIIMKASTIINIK